MSRIQALICVPFRLEQIRALAEFSQQLDLYVSASDSEDKMNALISKNKGAEILYCTKMPSKWCQDWGIRWIQCHWAGVNHLPLEEIPDRVIITNTSGIHSFVVAEHAIALVLILRRRIHRIIEYQARAEWRHEETEFARGSLFGETIAILGYGAIGQHVARIARGIGMKVAAYRRNPNNEFRAPGIRRGSGFIHDSDTDETYGPDKLKKLLGISDVIVNTLPFTPQTNNLLSWKEFDAVKKGALFINVGRGETVDEEALISAISSKRLAGAGLDVFKQEPLARDSPLWSMKNVIVSPHVAGMFPEYLDASFELFRENLRRYLNGKELLNRVQRERGY